MDRSELVTFIRKRGLAVVATRGPDGAPQAALVGVAATDQAEIIFDTSASSRKYRDVQANPGQPGCRPRRWLGRRGDGPV